MVIAFINTFLFSLRFNSLCKPSSRILTTVLSVIPRFVREHEKKFKILFFSKKKRYIHILSSKIASSSHYIKFEGIINWLLQCENSFCFTAYNKIKWKKYIMLNYLFWACGVFRALNTTCMTIALSGDGPAELTVQAPTAATVSK